MSPLDINIKIQMMLDSIKETKKQLIRDDIRPNRRKDLEDYLTIVKGDLRQMYYDLFKIIKN